MLRNARMFNVDLIFWNNPFSVVHLVATISGYDRNFLDVFNMDCNASSLFRLGITFGVTILSQGSTEVGSV